MTRDASAFEPIAIVGRGCILPGALTPDEFSRAMLDGRDAISACPDDRWRVRRAWVAGGDDSPLRERAATDRGGYVVGFDDVFDAAGFRVPPRELAGLDAVFRWSLHAAREAMREARFDVPRESLRGGVVLGNLSYPTEGLARWGEAVSGPIVLPPDIEAVRASLPAGARPDPRSRFSSGLPASLVARALGLSEGGLALDAACASSLYAIKLACDRLHDRRADVMLAGGVNAADDLFLHLGFTTLKALSLSGRSRPFHRDADGLLPAEGAAFVALVRLADAIDRGLRVLGIVRGVGLSNDGRGDGLLVPSPRGQVRAMRDAYARAGLAPADVSLVECHATGTAIGDATEIASMREVFAGLADVPIGSAKSNIGHAITVAGMAGVLKVLGAFEASVRPPTLHADDPIAALDGSPFRLLRSAEPWRCEGPRRAAVSGFGFGGNNAHVILEEWSSRAAPIFVSTPARSPDLAVVGLGVRVSGGAERELARALFDGEAVAAGSVSLRTAELRFPPKDLADALAQQTFVLAAAQDALRETRAPLPRDRTSVIVGMQCDAELSRVGLLPRLVEWTSRARHGGRTPPRAWIDGVAAGFDPQTPAWVLGCMPNVIANRVNSQLDLGGPSYAVSSDELSGIDALALAARALGAGEIDVAVIGAVDVACDPVHEEAARALLPPSRSPPCDAAVVMIVKRLDDARRDGDDVRAVVRLGATERADLRYGLATSDDLASVTPLLGHAHAASGLLHVASAALACAYRAEWSPRLGEKGMPWLPSSSPRSALVEIDALGGRRGAVTVIEAPSNAPRPAHFDVVRTLHAFSGRDRAGVIDALARGRESLEGPARLVLLAARPALGDAIARARAALEQGRELRASEGMYFRETPLRGELAFVFSGPGGAYPTMGSDLVRAFPELLERSAARSGDVRAAAGWMYAPAPRDGAARPKPSAEERLWGASLLSQLHAEFTRRVLGLAPQAVLGFCSGETNALFAMGAWEDMADLRRAIGDARVYDRELAGAFDVARRAWTARGAASDPTTWETWRLLADEDRVRDVLASEALVHLTIVNAPRDVVIAGEAAACSRAIARIAPERAQALDYNLTIHCPEMTEFASTWRALHHRTTAAVPGVRFYTHATCSHYALDADSVADALLGQALTTVDFPRLVRNAWNDGVRIFVEHGPQGSCTAWIKKALADREHLAVALDLASEPSLDRALHVAAQLAAAGVAVDFERLAAKLDAVARSAAPADDAGAPTRSFRAHRPLVPIMDRAVADEVFVMEPAPKLPPVLEAIVAEPAEPVAPAVCSSRAEALVAAYRELVAHQVAAQRAFVGASERALIAVYTALVGAGEAHVPERERSSRKTAFSREDLVTLASSAISSVFGPMFEKQDAYRRQVRLPEPPLLLVDRVTGIDAEPGVLDTGTIWTETDVLEGSWYLHDARMPPGLMIEAGQADLLLISWMGIDFLNQDQRVYRLLGCELTYHGGLPRAGDTLRYDIHIDAHAEQGDTRLFFFHYDCRIGDDVRLSVRRGQAGFFGDAELRDSRGVVWSAEEASPTANGRVDAPRIRCTRRTFSESDVRALSEGRVLECFGPGFELAETHVRSPRIQPGAMLMLGSIDVLDASGGPWKHGYLRGTRAVAPDDWPFAGHFKNDPCMPGTLLFEGCLQAMAFYLIAMGYALDRDGWRFEPVPDETFELRCRGQVLPTSKKLVYEIFVDELIDGPLPTLYAALLGTVDGLPAFQCSRMGLRLCPDWPLTTMMRDIVEEGARCDAGRMIAEANGVRFDHASLLACALGRPSDAFGPAFEVFDGLRRLPRLPGPPYHFISRVRSIVEGEPGVMRAGTTIECEYDVPSDAWYFDASGRATMPFAILLEVLLQPCGWLTAFVGCPLAIASDVCFRNLEGSGALSFEPGPSIGTLTTRVRLTALAELGDTLLTSFEVACRAGDRDVYAITTRFGHFLPSALARQEGLPTIAGDRAARDAPSDYHVDLTSRPARFFGARGLRLPDLPLRMLDALTGYWPDAGRAGLGRMRAVKRIDPSEWYFKAHFFQDPVQPGSLGLDAMIQLAEAYAIERGVGAAYIDPRFELGPAPAWSWKYRGQVVPKTRVVTVELEIVEIVDERTGATRIVADAWLWADELRIFHAERMAVRVVDGGDQ